MSSFNKRVKQIANAEKDVDKVLKAARLQRNPQNRPNTDMVWEYALVIISIVGIFALMITMVICSR